MFTWKCLRNRSKLIVRTANGNAQASGLRPYIAPDR